ncbi:MAG: hypothetical protein GX589_01265 [Deltaproteobacteria bacterium]|nr:hypothetical protein [Deltaproteobacteria bacterium]
MSKKRRAMREGGTGAVLLLIIVGGLVLAWFVFMGIMDMIGDNHARKVKDRMERMGPRKVAPVVHREIKGYQVKY